MKIPKLLTNKLSKDTALHGATMTIIGEFTNWFEASQTFFFPEYTKHDMSHAEAVCWSMTDLITSKSQRFLTREDCAAIVLTALLHDCAMNLTPVGFQNLLKSEYNGSVFISPLNPKWDERLQIYLKEISRLDAEQQEELFESPESAKQLLELIADKSPRYEELITRGYEPLIGEFLRRNHADIAHHIAMSGIDDLRNDKQLLKSINEHFKFRDHSVEVGFGDIVGYIARSHNYSLRGAIDSLKEDGRRIYCNVHMPYIMGLLRIADYLEIKADRASKLISKWRTFESPKSKQEWHNHQAIYQVTTSEQDPETLSVHATPKNVRTFLSLQNLLKSIQRELDMTWANWGETYGSDQKLNVLGIRYRRIRSNIDDVKKFGQSVDYIPIHAKFRTSDGELLKLLVGPLYGQKPEYGARELMQNAIDACLERENYLKNHKQLTYDSPSFTDNADVVVTLEENADGTGDFVIQDSGIGMTADVIQNYFFIAGASYRTSDEWKNLHTKDECSQILRTGRFGIGLLAAFLLGHEIKVTTRHISQPENGGITFLCRLNQQEIELKRASCKVGTEIRVRLDGDKFRQLCGREEDEDKVFGISWDWYTGSNPKIIRRIKLCREESLEHYSSLEKNNFELVQEHYLPEENGELELNWRRLSQSTFDDVQWNWLAPDLTCNNFRIGKSDRNGISGPHNTLWRPTYGGPNACSHGIALASPSLNIYDSNATFPIDLTRSGTVIDCDERIRSLLIEAICRDLLGSYLMGIPNSLKLTWKYLVETLSEIPYATMIREGNILRHPAINMFSGLKEDHFLMWNLEGITLAEPAMIQDFNTQIIKYVLRLPKNKMTEILDFPSISHTNEIGILHGLPKFSTQRFNSFIPCWIQALIDGPPPPKHVNLINSEDIIFTHFSSMSCFESIERAILLDQSWIEEGYGQYVNHLHCHRVNDHMNLYSTTSNPESWLDVDSLKLMNDVRSEYLIGFWKINPTPKKEVPISPLAKVWKDIIRQPLIPFDLETRKRELAHAYEELAPEIACWEKGGTYRAARELELQQRQNNT